MKRLFIAVEVSDEIKAAVEHIQALVELDSKDVKWVQKENVHLTLRFLGGCPEEKIEEIRSVVESVAARNRAFVLRSDRLGAFPSPKRARVIWIGINPEPALEKFYSEISDALEPIGFALEERPYHAHLTIGRLRNPRPVDLGPAEEKVALRFDFVVDEVVLFESRLSPKGPEYIPLAIFPLKPTNIGLTTPRR